MVFYYEPERSRLGFYNFWVNNKGQEEQVDRSWRRAETPRAAARLVEQIRQLQKPKSVSVLWNDFAPALMDAIRAEGMLDVRLRYLVPGKKRPQTKIPPDVRARLRTIITDITGEKCVLETPEHKALAKIILHHVPHAKHRLLI